jgi:hypothetical protein
MKLWKKFWECQKLVRSLFYDFIDFFVVKIPNHISDVDDLYEWCDRKMMVICAAILHNRIVPFSREHYAAAALQKAWRKSCNANVKFNDSILSLQNFFGIWHASRNLLQLRNAVKIIQSYFRNYLEALQSQRSLASTIINSAAKSLQAHHDFKFLSFTSLILQTFLKTAYLQLRSSKLKNSVQTVQSEFKTHVSLFRFTNIKCSISLIEEIFISCLQSFKFRRLSGHTKVIQADFSAEFFRNGYLLLRKNVMDLQVGLQGIISFFNFKKASASFRVMQAFLKCYHNHKLFYKKRLAAQTLASSLRAFEISSIFREYSNASSVIQGSVHSAFVLQNFTALLDCAVLIQCNFLQYLNSRKASNEVSAIAIIESNLYAYIFRKRLMRFRTKVSVSQDQFRAHLQCAKIQLIKEACSSIRAQLSMYVSRAAYLNYRENIQVFQSFYAAKKDEKYFRMAKDHIISIQAGFGSLSIILERRLKTESVKIVQGSLRAFTYSADFTFMWDVALTVQAYFFSLRWQMHTSAIAKAVLDVQGSIASFASLSHFKNFYEHAECLKTLRACGIARNFATIRSVTLSAQSFLSAMSFYHQTKSIKRSVHEIQRVFSSFLSLLSFKRACKTVETLESLRACVFSLRFRRIRNTMLVLQASFDSVSYRQHVLNLSKPTSLIQGTITAFISCIQFQNLRDHAQSISSLSSIPLARQFYECREATSIIQTCLKSKLHLRQVSTQLKEKEDACNIMRCIFTVFMFSRSFSKYRLFVISNQAVLHMIRARLIFSRYLEFVQGIQASFVTMQVMNSFQHERESVLILQSYFNAFLFRGDISHVVQSVTILQTAFKSLRYAEFVKEAICEEKVLNAATSIIIGVFEARKSVLALKYFRNSLIISQSGLHALRQCIHLRKYRESLVVVGTCLLSIKACMDYNDQKTYLIEERSAYVIQKQWAFFKKFILPNRRRSRILIQNWSRALLVQKRYKNLLDSSLACQSFFTSFLSLQERFLDVWSISRVQASVRGYLVRKNCPPEVSAARRRIEKANENWSPQNSITSRLSHCLQFLLFESQSLSQQVDALKELEYLTSLLPECCNTALEAGAVPALYSFLASLNRSLPHQDIATYSLGILKHLSDHDPEAVLDLNICGKVLMERMTSFREHPQILLRVLKLLDVGCGKVEYFAMVRLVH